MTSRVLDIQRVFVRHRQWFEVAEVASVSCADHAAAQRLLDDLRSGRAPFPVDVPAEPRALTTRPESGYLGLVTRADLPIEAAAGVFADVPPPYVGPVLHGGRYHVYRLLAGKTPEMTESVYELCSSLLDAASDPSGGT